MHTRPALLALTLVLTLAACGGDDPTAVVPAADAATQDTDAETTTDGAVAAPQETTEPTASATPAATAASPEAEPTEEAAEEGVAGYGSSSSGASEPSADAVFVEGTDSVAWAQTEVAVPAGSVELALACGPDVPHGLAIEEVASGARLLVCDEAKTLDLAPGTYTFFCTVPGHREAGMEGTLTAG